MPLTEKQKQNLAERQAATYQIEPYTKQGYQPDYYTISNDTYEDVKGYFPENMVPVWAGENALRDYAGHKQSIAAQWGNAGVKTLGLAATTAIQGFTSIGGLVVGGANWLFNGMDAKAFSIAYDNGINEAIDIFNKNMEEAFPNYYTNEQLNADALDPQSWFTANFFADKFIKNLGFTVGAIVGGAGVGKVSSSTLKLLSRTLTTAKAAGTLEVVTNAIKAGKTFDQALAPIAKTLQRIDATSAFIAQTGAAAAEASIEAFGTKQEIMNQLVSEYKMKNGVEPTEQELKEMDNIASGVTNAQFGLNMGILWASNALQFGRFLRGNAPEKTIWKNLQKNITTDVKDGVTTYAKREAFQPVTKFGKVMYGVGRPVVNIAKIGVPESLEEASQSVFSNAAMNYALAKYDNDGVDTIDNLLNSVAYGLNQTIGTKEGQESMLLGFLTGMISAPIGRKGKKAEKAMLEEQSNIAVGVLNNTKLNPAMKQLLDGSYRGAKFSNDKNSALEQDDDFSIRNANHDIFKNWVQSRLAVADKQVALDEISEIEQLDKPELAKYLGITEDEAEQKINKGFFKELKSEVNRLSGHLDFVNKTYTVQSLTELARLQGKELDADEIKLLAKHIGKLQDAAYAARADYDNAVKRYNQLTSEVRTRPEIDNATFEAFAAEATAIAKSHPGQKASQEAADAFIGKVIAFKNKINDTLLENRIESAEEASEVINKLVDIGRLNVSIDESAKFLTSLNNKDGVRGILKQFESISKNTNVGKTDAQNNAERVVKEVSDTLGSEISALEEQLGNATAEQADEIKQQINDKAQAKEVIDNIDYSEDHDSILNELFDLKGVSQEAKNNVVNAINEVKEYEKLETTEKGSTDNILWNDQLWNKLALGYTYGLSKFITLGDKNKIDTYCSQLTDKQLTEEVEYKILPRETGDNREIKGKARDGFTFEWNNSINHVIAAYHKGQIIGVIYPPNAIIVKKDGKVLGAKDAADEMIKQSFKDPAARTNLHNSFATSAKLYHIAGQLYDGSGNVQDITNEVLTLAKPVAAKGQLNILPYSPNSTDRPLLSTVVNKPTFNFEGKPIIYSITQKYDKDTGGFDNVLQLISGDADKLFGDAFANREKTLKNINLTSRYWIFMRTPGSNDGFWVPLELPSIDNIADKEFQASVVQSISDALALAEAESAKQLSNIGTAVVEEFDTLMRSMYIATEDGTRRLLMPRLEMVKGKVVINVYVTDYANKESVLVSSIKPENITALRSTGTDVIDIMLKEMQSNKVAAQVDGIPIPNSRNAFKVGLSKEDKTSGEIIAKLAYVNTDHVEGRNVELYLKPNAVLENKAAEAVKDAPSPVTPVQPITIEAKKADIERRRQEELELRNSIIPQVTGSKSYRESINGPNSINKGVWASEKEAEDSMWIEMQEVSDWIDSMVENNIPVQKIINKVGRLIGVQGKASWQLLANERERLYRFIKAKADGKVSDSLIDILKNSREEINAKYDAELAELEVAKPVATAPIAKEEKPTEGLWYLNHTGDWSTDELGRLAEIEIVEYSAPEDTLKALAAVADAIEYMALKTDMAGTEGYNKIDELSDKIRAANPTISEMQAEKEAMTTETVDQRIENIRHMLPDWIDYKHLSMLIGKIKTSGNTVGAFMDTVVYLTETAPIGTEYHEAFHVVFRLLLTSQEQAELLEAARKQRGRIITVSERNAFRASHPYLKGASKSRVDAAILEEELAEGFRKYKTGEKKSFLTKIVDFFKKLLGLGKSIRENYDTIKAFYDKIDKGEYSYYTQKHNNFTQRKGEPALSSIPAGSHKDGTSRFLTGTKARRLINTIAATYIQRKQSSTVNPDALLKDVIGELQKTYLPNTIKASLTAQGITMDEGQFTLALTYTSALNPLNSKSVSIIKKEVEKIESLLNIEYDSTFEDETDETGERSYEVRNENIGGFGSLTKEVRQYIALTEVTEPDDFGIIRTHAVDAVGVYNALSNILANTTQSEIISKLEAVKDLYSPSTTAVINRILNDAPVELQFKFIQAMNKYKIKYWMLRFKDGVANFADANSKNLTDTLMRRWNSQFMQNKTADKVAKLRDAFNALDRAHVNATNLTREECIASARVFAERFNNLNIDIPVGYIAVSLAKTSENPDAKVLAAMFPDVAPINKDANKQAVLVNIAAAIKDKGSVVPSKESKEASYTYWKHIAENSLTFHEAMGDDNFMNVEGETVYTKVLGTYIIRKAYELNANTLKSFNTVEDFKKFYPEIHDEDLIEITYEYLKDSPLVALRDDTYWGARGTEMMSDMKVWFVDGIREDKRDGLTWKSMTARDKTLFEISSVLSKAHDERQHGSNFATVPLYMRILESAGTANIVNVTYNKKAVNPDYTIDKSILQGCIQLIKQEYNSIAKVAKLADSPFKNLITGKQSGLKFINAHVLFDTAETEDAFTAAAKEGKTFEEAGFTTEQMEAFITKALINDGVRVVNGLIEMGVIDKETNEKGDVTLKNVLLPKLKLSNGRPLVDSNKTVDKVELFNFAVNELVNRTLVNQWFDGNPAYSFTTYENYIKRNKGANGGVNSYHPGKINVAHVSEYETPVELKGKVHKVNRNDGQQYEKMSWKMWKMFSKGLPDNIFGTYMDIITYDGSPETSFSTDEGVVKTKQLEEFNMALNSDKDLSYDMYNYGKCSSFTLTREYTSYTTKEGTEAINALAADFRNKWKKVPKSWEEFHDEFLPDLLAFERATMPYWIARPGSSFEHNMLNGMVDKDVYMVQPTSMTKRMVKHVSTVTDNSVNLIPQVNEASTYGEQTPTPPGEDMTIDGTQKNTTVPTETQDNEKAREYKVKLGQRTAATLEVAMAILRDVDEQGRVKYSMRKLLDGIIETLATTGADPQLISFFSVDAQGRPVYDFNNLPSTRKQAAKFFMAHFNKVVLKQKTVGAKRILKSDAGVQIMEVTQDIKHNGTTIKKGTILQAYQFDKLVRDGADIEVGKNLSLRDLAYDKLDESTGVRYAEILIPSHDARAYNLKPGDAIPADLAEAFGVRIPTQDKASMMVYRVVGFMPSYYSKVAVFPKEIVLLKGADFDVDKEFMNLLATYKILTEAGKTEQKIYGRYKDATPTVSEQFDEYYSYYKRHKIIRHVIVDKLSVNDEYLNLLDELEKVEADINKVKKIDKNDYELPGLYDLRNNWRKSIELVEKATFEEVMKELQLPATLSEFATEAKARRLGTDYNPVINVPDVLNNEMMGIASKLLTGSEDAFDKVLTPMNTDIADAALKVINNIRGKDTNKMQSCHSFADIMTGFKLVALGSSNIGVVARAGMTIKLLAQLGVTLEEDYAIEFEGKTLDKFVFETDKGVRVGTETNENITMQVDAIKGLMPVHLNLTQNILGVVVTMSGLGMGLQNALYFANSRIIRDLTMRAANSRSAIKAPDEISNFEDFVEDYIMNYAAKNRGFKQFKGSLTQKELLLAIGTPEQAAAEGVSKEEYAGIQMHLLFMLQKLLKVSDYARKVGDVQALHKGSLSSFTDVRKLDKTITELSTDPMPPFDVTPVLNDPYISELIKAFRRETVASKDMFIQMQDKFISFLDDVLVSFKPFVGNIPDNVTKLEDNILTFLTTTKFKRLLISSGLKGVVPKTQERFVRALDAIVKTANLKDAPNTMYNAVLELGKADPGNRFVSFMRTEPSKFDVTTDSRVRLHPEMVESIIADFNTLYAGGSKGNEAIKEYATQLVAFLLLKSGMNFVNESYVKFLPAVTQRPLSEASTAVMNDLSDNRIEGIGVRTTMYEFMHMVTKDKDSDYWIQDMLVPKTNSLLSKTMLLGTTIPKYLSLEVAEGKIENIPIEGKSAGTSRPILYINLNTLKNASYEGTAEQVALKQAADLYNMHENTSLLSSSVASFPLVIKSHSLDANDKPTNKKTYMLYAVGHNATKDYPAGIVMATNVSNGKQLQGSVAVYVEATKETMLGDTFNPYSAAYENMLGRGVYSKGEPVVMPTVAQQPITKASEIYELLGSKTVSENVKIVSNPNDYLTEQYNNSAVVAYKGAKLPQSFENPYHVNTKATTKENVIAFIDFVLTSTEPQAVWMREQMQSGRFKNKPIYYGNTRATKENQPSHATALDYLINKYDWNAVVVTQPIKSLQLESKEWADTGKLNTITTPIVQQSSTNIINIYAGANENAHLSNFAKRPFTHELLNNEMFNTVEGAYQVNKLAFTGGYYYGEDGFLNEEGKKIWNQLKVATGAEAKRIGRTIKNLNNKEWDKASSNIMEILIRESFEQNSDALKMLFATGNATLTHTQDKGKWGKEFPRLLMKVRSELSGGTSIETVPKPLQLELKLESGFDGAVTPPIVSPLTSETDKSVEAAAKSAEETATKCFGEGITNDAPPKLPENFNESGEEFFTYNS